MRVELGVGPARGLTLAALAVLGVGCSSPTQVADRCNSMVVAVAPAAPAVAVGDELGLTASYTGAVECRPNVPAADLRWISSDPAIAPVDSLSGRVTGRRAGEVLISVRAPGGTAVLGSVALEVTGP